MRVFPSGGGELPLLASVTRRVQLLNEKVQMFAFDTLFSRMRKKLSNVPLMKVGSEHMAGWALIEIYYLARFGQRV